MTSKAVNMGSELRKKKKISDEEPIFSSRKLSPFMGGCYNCRLVFATGSKSIFKPSAGGPNLKETSFQEYFRDVSTVEPHETARCKVPIREGVIVFALSYFGASKAPNVDSRPCETSLKMPHMIVHFWQ